MIWGFGNLFELDNFSNYRIFKSTVSRLNLFKFWLSHQLHFFRDMICLLDSSSSFSSSPSVITSVGCSENSETIYSTEKSRNWLVRRRKCTSRNVGLSGSFFVRSIFVKLFQCFILCLLRSLRYAFFLWSFWTQLTSNFLSCINVPNNQI